jgi:hypothetical protein
LKGAAGTVSEIAEEDWQEVTVTAQRGGSLADTQHWAVTSGICEIKFLYENEAMHVSYLKSTSLAVIFINLHFR